MHVSTNTRNMDYHKKSLSTDQPLQEEDNGSLIEHGNQILSSNEVPHLHNFELCKILNCTSIDTQ